MRGLIIVHRAAVEGAKAYGRPRLILKAPVATGMRSIHASSSASRKKSSKPIEEDEFEAEEEEVDLFDSSSSPSSGDRSGRRSELISQLNALRGVDTAQRKSAVSATRVGGLRRIIQLSDTPEELEGLREVLRTWRWAGKKVTTQTAKELIGRCCNLGRPDLALEFSEDRLQYGLPDLPVTSLARLHHALLQSEGPVSKLPRLSETISISPTLALLRLALLSKQDNSSHSKITPLLERVQKGGKESIAAPEWRKDGMRLLGMAGGVWADAGQRLSAESA